MHFVLRVCSLLCLTTLIFQSVNCKIEIIDDTGKSFKISYNDVLIISHNVHEPELGLYPVMEVGVGEFEASDHLGNWQINDTVNQKLALDLYTLGKQLIHTFNSCVKEMKRKN